MSSSPPADPAEPALFRRDFALILVIQLAFGIAFSSFFLLPKFVVTALDGSPRQVGFVGALAVVAAVVASPLCGKLLDRGRRAPLMAWGCLLSGWAALGFVRVCEVGPYLYGLRAIQGVGYTLYFVAAATLVSDICPPARLGQALGWFGSAGLLMNAIATLGAERIADHWGWHAVFTTAAVSGLAGAVLSLAVREPRLQPRPARRSELPIKAPQRLRVLWAAAAGGAAFGGMFTFTQPLALSLGDTNISPLFSGYTAAALFVRLAFGNAADRFGRARIGSLALGVYSLVLVATGGLAHGWLPYLGLGFGLAHGAFYPSLNALALEGIAKDQRGSAGAYFNAAFNAGVFVVTFCFGQIAQLYGYRVVFLLVACLSATGCSVLLGQSRKPGLARS